MSQDRIICLLQNIKGLTNPLASTMGGFAKVLKRMNTPEFKKFTERFGWLELFAMPYILELQRVMKEKGEDAAWQELIIDFTDPETLENCVEKPIKQNPVLRARKRFILHALALYKKKDYVASIPLLLSQIEGMIWDEGVTQGKVSSKSNSRVKVDSSGNQLMGPNNKPQIYSAVGELIYELWGNDSQLAQHARNNVYSPELRNPILHGRDLAYDDERTAVMLVIILMMAEKKVRGE